MFLSKTKIKKKKTGSLTVQARGSKILARILALQVNHIQFSSVQSTSTHLHPSRLQTKDIFVFERRAPHTQHVHAQVNSAAQKRDRLSSRIAQVSSRVIKHAASHFDLWFLQGLSFQRTAEVQRNPLYFEGYRSFLSKNKQINQHRARFSKHQNLVLH